MVDTECYDNGAYRQCRKVLDCSPVHFETTTVPCIHCDFLHFIIYLFIFNTEEFKQSQLYLIHQFVVMEGGRWWGVDVVFHSSDYIYFLLLCFLFFLISYGPKIGVQPTTPPPSIIKIQSQYIYYYYYFF